MSYPTFRNIIDVVTLEEGDEEQHPSFVHLEVYEKEVISLQIDGGQAVVLTNQEAKLLASMLASAAEYATVTRPIMDSYFADKDTSCDCDNCEFCDD